MALTADTGHQTERRRSLLRWLPAHRMFMRVFLVFGSLLLAMTALYGMLIVPLQQDSLLKVMYSQADIVSRSIIQACSEAMITDDFGFIVEHNLQVLQNNRNIRSVLITPKRGTTIRIAPEGWAMQESDPQAAPDQTLEHAAYGIVSNADGTTHYRYSTPIRFSGLSWGSIEINFATTEYDANTREMYKQLLLISMLVVLAILPVGYFFALWLIRPIADISHAASRVAQGDLNAHVDIARQDEIGQLSRSFNQMVDALQESRTRVRFYNQELEQKVAERTHELDELNRTLDQRVRDEISKRKEQETLLIHQSRLAAMGEMIGAIAHQWRQPLNALSLVMQNIRLQHGSGRLTEQSMARMQEKSEQLVQRMSSTIDDFRDFFKPDKHAVTFNLAQVIRSSAGIMDGVFNNHCIALSIDCGDDIEVFGIPGEFSQVILNLLSNAKDAVQDTHQRSPRIQVHASRDGDLVRICVDDNGGGIAPEVMARIYEPYFTTKNEGKGSGIGLYMSKMIVENNMHGRLEASNTDEGTRFTIELDTPGRHTETASEQVA